MGFGSFSFEIFSLLRIVPDTVAPWGSSLVKRKKRKEQCDAGGDWLCLPYAVKDSLDGIFKVQGIPTFIIVAPDGRVINKSGRGLVPDAVAADFPWVPPLVGDLESPEGINETPAIILMLENCTSDSQSKILATVGEIAKEYDSPEPDLLFFAAKKNGGVSSKVRGMCGLPSGDSKAKEESECPPVVLLDCPDRGGYYIGQMKKALDASGIRQMIQDYKDKKLERKQLGRQN